MQDKHDPGPPGWIMRPTDEFRVRVADALGGEQWITDGNTARRAT